MKAYLDIVKNVLENGEWKDTRTQYRALTVPNIVFSHNMKNGFPLLTTRKLPWQSIRVELEGFLKGITNKTWYQDRLCHFWDHWCNPQQLPKELILIDKYDKEVYDDINEDNQKKWQKNNPDLGPLGYSYQWRNFDGDYKPIPYIWTDLNKNIEVQISPDLLVGQTFDGIYGAYTVISYDNQDKYYNKRYTVQFHNTGYIKNNLNKKQIVDLRIFDIYYPNIAGVACVGDYKKINIDKKICTKLLNQWKQMIHRCYNRKHPAFQNYGQQNIWVCNRWLVFEYFLTDIQNLDGWDQKLNHWNLYHLDKDIKGHNYYSPDTCLWVDRIDNNNATKKNYYFDAIDPLGNSYKNIVGLNRFCKRHKLKTKNVEASMKNNSNTSYGWKFIRKQQFKKQSRPKQDQLQYIVDKLHTNPNDRRMVCSAWNPHHLHIMGLPPCHMLWGLVHINGVLNLYMTQRSCDVALGVPSNIASYALLLHLLCKEGNLIPGNLTILLADCHIYENHINGIKEQLSRVPTELPRLTIPDKSSGFSIFDWTYQDVLLENYNPQPRIHMGDIAV